MSADPFEIIFYPIHYPEKPTFDRDTAVLSDESAELLETLYRFFQNKMIAARTPKQLVKAYDSSIFACCVKEGYVLLKCTINADKFQTALDGFLLKKDENDASLRTAWRLVRWPLLFLCADGWKYDKKKGMTPDEILEAAAKMSFPEDYRNKLVKIGMSMMSAEAPYNFALCNRSDLPLDFSVGNTFTLAENSVELADTETINLNPETVSNRREWNKVNEPIKDAIKLIHTNYKTALKWLSESDNHGQDDKNKLKNKLSSYPSEYIWCLCADYNGIKYVELLENDTAHKMCNGGVDFIMFQRIFEKAENQIYRLATQPRQPEPVINEAYPSDDPRRYSEPAQKPEKKLGFIGKRLHRNDD